MTPSRIIGFVLTAAMGLVSVASAQVLEKERIQPLLGVGTAPTTGGPSSRINLAREQCCNTIASIGSVIAVPAANTLPDWMISTASFSISI